MYKILTLNKIASVGLNQLSKEKYEIGDQVANPDGIVLRSFSMHEMNLPDSLLAVARAGAGVNNIPVDKCSEKGVVVFNTPGANANAVKELAIASLLLSSRKIIEGVNWAQTLTGDDVEKQVEKGKSAFAGPEIAGKKLGVIGLGAIGVMVANAAIGLGMEVMGFDPYLSIDAAWGLSSSVCRAGSLKEIYENCDYITLHVPLTPETKGMIGKDALSGAKKGLRILNFSRGALVDTPAILKAIEDEVVACYVTDFPTAEMLGNDKIITIPHLGASTPESEDNCAKMACAQLKDYLENGNIINSVNFPNCFAEREGAKRVCVIHSNTPNKLSQISSLFASENINIIHMLNKSKGEYAYTMLDVDTVPNNVIEKVKAIDGVISMRII